MPLPLPSACPQPSSSARKPLPCVLPTRRCRLGASRRRRGNGSGCAARGARRRARRAPRPAAVAEVVEDSREDGVAPRGVLGMRVRDQPGDLHRERSRLFASPEPGERSRFLEAVLRPFQAVGARLQEWPALFEQVEGLLRVSPVELEVSQQLMCPRRAIGVLRQAEDLERAAGESRRSDGVTALSVEPELRPVELGADTRALEAAAERERRSRVAPRRERGSRCRSVRARGARRTGSSGRNRPVGPRIRGNARRRRSRIELSDHRV